MSVVEWPVVSCRPGDTPKIAGISNRKRSDAPGNGPLDPVIRGALGVVRESTNLLFHVAAFGVVLVSGAKTSRSVHSVTQAGADCDRSNVIPFSR